MSLLDLIVIVVIVLLAHLAPGTLPLIGWIAVVLIALIVERFIMGERIPRRPAR